MPPSRPEPAPTPIMEPRALDLLKRMSATLSAAKALTYRSRSTGQVPANTGQLVTLFATSDRRCNGRPAAPSRSPVRFPTLTSTYNPHHHYRPSRPEKQVYSVANAPATIDPTSKFMVDKTGIQFPLR